MTGKINRKNLTTLLARVFLLFILPTIITIWGVTNDVHAFVGAGQPPVEAWLVFLLVWWFHVALLLLLWWGIKSGYKDIVKYLYKEDQDNE